MNKILKFILFTMFCTILSCATDDSIEFHLDSFDTYTYYSDEIIPEKYKSIYGKWKLYKVSGGFSGGGHEPNYDFLEIKNIGIYGLIRNDSLFEYGKIEIYTFDTNPTDYLQVRLVPDNKFTKGSTMAPIEKYINLKRNDSLDLISACCDFFNYHYTRIK